MSRFIGFVADPTAGGTVYEQMVNPPTTTPVKMTTPTIFLPATSANVDDQLQTLDRKDEVRGRRADVAPQSFASRPLLQFESRAYPKLLRTLLRNALGGSVAHAGGPAPKAYEDTVTTIQSGVPPTLQCWLLREEQLDLLTGLVVDNIEVNLPIDGEGTIKAQLRGFAHHVTTAASPKNPDGTSLSLPTVDYTGYEYAFMLRDVVAKHEAGLAEYTKFAGLQFTFDNNFINDFRSIMRPGHNIALKTIGGVTKKLWLPNFHKLGAQNVSGKLDFSAVDPTIDLNRLFTQVEKLQAELFAGPLGTTPAAEEALKLVFYKHALIGGGADPLVREGDQVSSYDFSAYLDESANKDVEATFVGATELT